MLGFQNAPGRGQPFPCLYFPLCVDDRPVSSTPFQPGDDILPLSVCLDGNVRKNLCILFVCLFVCLFERDCIGLDIFIGSFDLMSNANYTSKRFGMLFHVASTGPLNVWRPLLTFNPNLIPNPHPNLYKTPKSRHLRLLLLPVVIFRNLHLLFPVNCTSYFP